MIVTFTDFGVTGPYLGQMKARVLEHAPNETIIDLMVDVPAFNIKAASILLSAFIIQFPTGTIFLCIVDPGVGTERKPLCIECDGQWFVGPDNGIFEQVIKKSQKVKAFQIIWRPTELSKSFHGRDLFAPVVAKISINTDFERKTIDPSSLVSLDASEKNQIIYIDTYGNCWTNIQPDLVNEDIAFHINNTHVSYAPVFADTDIGSAFWYVNSSGFVEFSINQGNAQELLKLEIGNIIRKI